jgi:hypothetical protein
VTLVLAVLALSHAGKLWFDGKLDPSFIGALIGAAGTIFAGTIAFVAADMSIQYSKQAAADAVKTQAEFKAEMLAAQAVGAKNMMLFCDDILKFFDNAATQADVGYINGMEALRISGLSVFYQGGVPPELQNKVGALGMRLNNLIQENRQWKLVTPPDAQVAERSQRNEVAADAITAVRHLKLATEQWFQDHPVQAP